MDDRDLPERPDSGVISDSSPTPEAAEVDTTPNVKAVRGRNPMQATVSYLNAKRKSEKFLELYALGHSIADATLMCNWTQGAYSRYRQVHRDFAMRVDALNGRDKLVQDFDGTHASFARIYFKMQYAWFHLLFFDELEKMPPGNILMVLLPPEHGKTTMFENYANEVLAVNPTRRFCIASEALTISQKILGRVRDRMEITGPFPHYVKRFGPFAPVSGTGRQVAQPWGAGYFNVYKKGTHDERDYSMLALGVGSSIVSTRTDHMHVDDPQSLKTMSRTNEIEDWFRQDCLSRPGESGITTIAATRVGEDDFVSRIADDPALDGILKVIKLPALLTDPLTGEMKPLFPEKYTLDQLDRQKRKVGPDAWDRNYMQNPGASRKHLRTFLPEHVEACLNPMISLRHECTAGSIVYVSLDPAIGSMNCCVAVEVTDKRKLILRRIREDIGFQRNEQIMAALETVVRSCNFTGRVTDVIVEAKNFQAGLARDERLLEMQRRHGFSLREHLTGINKYDEDIGVPSMAESFIRKEIVLPWADDDYTRHEVGELVKQLYAWKPGMRGNKLRQDRVMALWFAWILWQSRWKTADSSSVDQDAWKRQGIASGPVTAPSLVLPLGVRP